MLEDIDGEKSGKATKAVNPKTRGPTIKMDLRMGSTGERGMQMFLEHVQWKVLA
jgi:hypothetical protein